MPEENNNLPVIHSELSPVYRPDHRHRRAKTLVMDDRRFDPDGDKAVERMIGYISLMNGDDPMHQLWIDSCYPGIHGAMRFHLGHHPRVRMHIQCGVLAGVNPHEIMQVVPDCDVETIGAYETFFFDIRPQLENQTFIIETVITGITPQTSLKNPRLAERFSYGDLRLAIAYFAGWDEHLAFTADPKGLTSHAEEILRGIGRRSQLCKAVLASLAEEVTSENAREIIESLLMAGKEEEEETRDETQIILEQLRSIGEAQPVAAAKKGELSGEAEYPIPQGEKTWT